MPSSSFFPFPESRLPAPDPYALFFVAQCQGAPDGGGAVLGARVVVLLLARLGLVPSLAGVELRQEILERGVAGKGFLLRILEGIDVLGGLKDLPFAPTAPRIATTAA